MWPFCVAIAAFFVCPLSLATNPATNTTNSTHAPVQAQCSTTAECNHGVCNNSSNTCTCDRGYLTATGQPLCSYAQMSSTTAGVLEFVFPGFGFGQMYLHNWGLGFGKLALNFVIAGLITLSLLDSYKLGGRCLGSCAMGVLWGAALIGTVLAQAAWWLHDGVVIVQGNYVGTVGQPDTWHYEPYRDGNGYYIDGCTACSS